MRIVFLHFEIYLSLNLGKFLVNDGLQHDIEASLLGIFYCRQGGFEGSLAPSLHVRLILAGAVKTDADGKETCRFLFICSFLRQTTTGREEIGHRSVICAIDDINDIRSEQRFSSSKSNDADSHLLQLVYRLSDERKL